MKIVNDLGHDPGPVDGVHRRQIHLIAKRRVVEHGFHQILAIVKGAVDR